MADLNKKDNKENNVATLSVKDGALLTSKSPFLYREAYKSLRTNVMFAMASAPGKSKAIIVSSAEPNECKSTLSANLAVTLSELGVRVLLVDADLRNPTQHRIFKLPNVKGLSRLIVGIDKYEDAIYHDVVPNLDLITAGDRAPNPSELLGSENMADLFKVFEKDYEYIVVDTPPVNIVTDALMFVDLAAGVILAVREDVSTYKEIQKAVSNIEMTKTPVLGAVIIKSKNDSGVLDMVRNRYGKEGRYGKYGKYGKYGRYGYGYGYGYGKK